MGQKREGTNSYPNMSYNPYSILAPMCSVLCMLIPSPVHVGNIPLTISYDTRMYEGLNITMNCSLLVDVHPNGSIHWCTQLINPREVIHEELEIPISDTFIQLVVPST